jgi:peptidoglycan hydrolase FlgJ
MMDPIAINQAKVAIDTGLSKTTGLRSARSAEATAKAAVDFEAQYLSQMLAPMFENMGADGPFGGGLGEEVWRSMQVNEFGKALANQGGIGLADTVMQEMLRMQEQGTAQ